MTICKQYKRFPFIALMPIISAIFFLTGAKTKVYASAKPESDTAAIAYTAESVQDKPKEAHPVSEPATGTPLTVKEVWLAEDILHIYVLDGGDGGGQDFELNLSDYATPDDEYVTVQATDGGGRKSNSITFKNPYRVKPDETKTDSGESDTDIQGEQDAPDNLKPFTPDGTGTVVDNAAEKNGKEFFSIETPDGNVFYLIVDRQRNSENVYLLNAVTEQSLASLAKPGDGKTISAVETPPQIISPPAQTEPASDSASDAPVPEKKNDKKGTMAFIGILALAAGGAAYYVKIVRPKKDGAFASDFEPDDYENGETDLEDDDDDEDNNEDGDNE